METLEQAAQGSAVTIPGSVAAMEIWPLGTRFSGGLGRVSLMAEIPEPGRP